MSWKYPIVIGYYNFGVSNFQKKSREKVQKRHDNVMRLLVRRFITAEQRKRDDFGVTEDDVMEIRQDISTLRYELIDIFHKNGMKTPRVDPNDNQRKLALYELPFIIINSPLILSVAGKKGRVMERRILKDFQIGLVEGIVNEVLVKSHEPKDVFSQIAKAIGSRASSKSTNWNELVRKNTVVRDPIGSTQASMHRIHRRSLRRAIMDSAHKGLDMNTEKLLEYNPLLSEVSQTTRVAYVKFMTKKMKKDDHLDGIIIQNEADNRKTRLNSEGSESTKAKEAFGSIIKKASIKRRESEEELKVILPPESEDTKENIEAGRPDIRDFRSRTPIVEDPNEDRMISPEMINDDVFEQESQLPMPVILPPENSPSPKPSTPIPSPVPIRIDDPQTTSRAKTPSDNLQVASGARSSSPAARSPSPRGDRPVTPIIITPSKGKSAVSGRNLEGWI